MPDSPVDEPEGKERKGQIGNLGHDLVRVVEQQWAIRLAVRPVGQIALAGHQAQGHHREPGPDAHPLPGQLVEHAHPQREQGQDESLHGHPVIREGPCQGGQKEGKPEGGLGRRLWVGGVEVGQALSLGQAAGQDDELGVVVAEGQLGIEGPDPQEEGRRNHEERNAVARGAAAGVAVGGPGQETVHSLLQGRGGLACCRVRCLISVTALLISAGRGSSSSPSSALTACQRGSIDSASPAASIMFLTRDPWPAATARISDSVRPCTPCPGDSLPAMRRACSSWSSDSVQLPRLARTSERVRNASRFCGANSTARLACSWASGRRSASLCWRIACAQTIHDSPHSGSISVPVLQTDSASPYLPSRFEENATDASPSAVMRRNSIGSSCWTYSRANWDAALKKPWSPISERAIPFILAAMTAKWRIVTESSSRMYAETRSQEPAASLYLLRPVRLLPLAASALTANRRNSSESSGRTYLATCSRALMASSSLPSLSRIPPLAAMALAAVWRNSAGSSVRMRSEARCQAAIASSSPSQFGEELAAEPGRHGGRTAQLYRVIWIDTLGSLFKDGNCVFTLFQLHESYPFEQSSREGQNAYLFGTFGSDAFQNAMEGVSRFSEAILSGQSGAQPEPSCNAVGLNFRGLPKRCFRLHETSRLAKLRPALHPFFELALVCSFAICKCFLNSLDNWGVRTDAIGNNGECST